MVKKITIAIIILISLLMGHNLFQQTMEAVKSGERLSQAVDTVHDLEIKNRELKEQLTQIKSREFIEETARNKLGLAKKGETIVVIPEEKLKQILGVSQSAQINRLPNWLGWFRVFFK